MKIAVVIQRFGEDIVGGSEYYALRLLEKLSNYHDITVYTTKAKNYTTWKNEYSESFSSIGKIKVKRFDTVSERNMDEFNKFSDKFFSKKQRSTKDEEEWIIKQGPYSPKLLSAIEKESEFYDTFIFFTYLYYPTVFGIKLVKKPKILISTAHDELPLYLEIMKDVFYTPEAILFLTEEEKELISKVFPQKGSQIRKVIGSIGIEKPEKFNEKIFLKKFLPLLPYAIYLGRIDEGKGVDYLVKNFLKFSRKRYIQLVLAGKLNMKIPSDFRIKNVGFLSEEEKWSALLNAIFYIHPSMYESLSITVLEAMAVGTPVIVNGNSPVLLGHVKKSNGGLYYTNTYELFETMNLLMENDELRKKLGENGKLYIKNNYSWELVLKKFNEVLVKLSKS